MSNICFDFNNYSKIQSFGGDYECTYCQRYVSEGQGDARATEAIDDDRWGLNIHNRWHVPLTESDFENYPIEICYNPLSKEWIDYSQLEKDMRRAIYEHYKALEKDVLKHGILYISDMRSSISIDGIRIFVRDTNKNPDASMSMDPMRGRKISEKDATELRFFGRVVSMIVV